MGARALAAPLLPSEDAGTGARWWGACIATGLAAGCAGLGFTALLHAVRQLPASSPVLFLAAAGALVGLTGQLLRHQRGERLWGPRLLPAHRPTGVVQNVLDGALQTVSVGFGISIGREGAPRQVGSAVAERLARALGLSTEQTRTLVACGAGAGLSAAYTVPASGALFTLEILLVSVAVRHVVPAVLTSLVASGVTYVGDGGHAVYDVTAGHVGLALYALTLLVGGLAGMLGLGFRYLTQRARRRSVSGWPRLPVLSALFCLAAQLHGSTGLLLGNGQLLAQDAFDGAAALGVLVALVLAKPLLTAACLSLHGSGGAITPALATGAALGALVASGARGLGVDAALVPAALVGAAAVLAVTQKAPFTGAVLVLELTRTGTLMTLPVVVGVSAAMLTARALGDDHPPRPWAATNRRETSRDSSPNLDRKAHP